MKRQSRALIGPPHPQLMNSTLPGMNTLHTVCCHGHAMHTAAAFATLQLHNCNERLLFLMASQACPIDCIVQLLLHHLDCVMLPMVSSASGLCSMHTVMFATSRIICIAHKLDHGNDTVKTIALLLAPLPLHLQMAAQGQEEEAVRQGRLVCSDWAGKRAVDSQRQPDQIR